MNQKLPKRRVKRNVWGNIKGYEGNRKVEDFGLDEYQAIMWRDRCDFEKARETLKNEQWIL